MKKKAILIWLAAMFAFLSGSSASAESITFEYTSFIKGFTGSLPAPIAVGDSVIWSYTFQSDAAATSVTNAGADYLNQGPLRVSVYHAGAVALTLTFPDIRISIRDNLSYDGKVHDEYEVSGGIKDQQNDAIKTAFFMALTDVLYSGKPDAIDGTGLLLAPPDLALFSASGMNIFDRKIVKDDQGNFIIETNWLIYTDVESVKTKPVPEPVTMVLLCMGIAGAAGTGRWLRN